MRTIKKLSLIPWILLSILYINFVLLIISIFKWQGNPPIWILLVYGGIHCVTLIILCIQETNNFNINKGGTMPLCGFNPKMLAGLTLFAQGLYEQADKRAKEDNCSLEKSYNSEIN